MPAVWWVELSLIPLMGRATLNSVLWGLCERSMTLGRFSADVWGYVPVLLDVWLQHPAPLPADI